MFNIYVKANKKHLKDTPSVAPSAIPDLSRFERYKHIDPHVGKGSIDELDRFLNSDIEPVDNPLAWWQAHEAQYPVQNIMIT